MDIDDVGLVVTLPENQIDWQGFTETFIPQLRANYMTHPYQVAILVPDLNIPNTHEIIAFQTIEVESSSPISYRLRGVIRRMYDTARVSGTVKIFVLQFWSAPFAVLEQPGWANNVAVTFKTQPVSGASAANLVSMTAYSLTLKQRALRPYAVENLLVGVYNTAGAGYLGSMTPKYGAGAQSYRLSWTARIRTQGCGINDSFGFNVSSESPPTTEAYLYFRVQMFSSDGTPVFDTYVYQTEYFTDGFGVRRYYKDVPTQTIATGSSIIAYVSALFSANDVNDPLLDNPSIITRRP